MEIDWNTKSNIETILVSLTPENTQMYVEELRKAYALNDVEFNIINKFVNLINRINEKPSIETLQREFPELDFANAQPIEEAGMNDFIKLFITKRKDKYYSQKLADLSMKVRNQGMTEEIIDTLDGMTKSDTVKSEYKEVFNDLQKVYTNEEVTKGIPTGVNIIDKVTGGLQKGAVTTLLGFTGSMKTTWALNISYNAMKEGKNVCYLSLEVSKLHIAYNLLSRTSFEPDLKIPVEHRDIKQHKLTKDKEEFLFGKVLPYFNNLPGKIFVLDETDMENYSLFALENKLSDIDKIAKEQTGNGIDMLVVDHAQLLKFSKDMSSAGLETSIINQYVSFFRQQCMNFVKSKRSIAVLILSQANRGGWEYAVKHNGNYQLTALADANELERASSMVMSVFSSDPLKAIRQAKVQLLKCRDGQTMEDAVGVFAEPAYYAFGDIVEGGGGASFEGTDLGSLLQMTEPEDLDQALAGGIQVGGGLESLDLGV